MRVAKKKPGLAHCVKETMLVALVATGMFLSIGCRGSSPRASLPPNPFAGRAFRSMEELGRAVVAAISDSSQPALDLLRVSEEEYRRVIWARIPVSELANIDVETAWSWVDRDSRKAIRRTLYDYGGKRLTFQSVRVQKETREFPAMRIHYGVRIFARDDSQNREYNIELLNVVAEIDGYFRVIAYDV